MAKWCVKCGCQPDHEGDDLCAHCGDDYAGPWPPQECPFYNRPTFDPPEMVTGVDLGSGPDETVVHRMPTKAESKAATALAMAEDIHFMDALVKIRREKKQCRR